MGDGYEETWPTGRRHGFLARLRARVVLSFAAIVGWIAFVLLYAAFAATYFTLFQNLVVFFVSLLLLGAVVVGAWISFGLGWGRGFFED